MHLNNILCRSILKSGVFLKDQIYFAQEIAYSLLTKKKNNAPSLITY